jgi:hypothetical protein
MQQFADSGKVQNDGSHHRGASRTVNDYSKPTDPVFSSNSPLEFLAKLAKGGHDLTTQYAPTILAREAEQRRRGGPPAILIDGTNNGTAAALGAIVKDGIRVHYPATSGLEGGPSYKESVEAGVAPALREIEKSCKKYHQARTWEYSQGTDVGKLALRSYRNKGCHIVENRVGTASGANSVVTHLRKDGWGALLPDSE